MIQTYFLEEEIKYTGEQLASHWIYRKTGQPGDAIAAFAGGCHVDLSHMVDLADVRDQKQIFSHRMLHFIVEHFDQRDLEKAVLRQRLLVCLLQALLEERLGKKIARKGDDLFLDGKKLSVSIATVSAVSSLIHLGINIISKDTPLPTLGLEDLKIPPREFGLELMGRYRDEIESIHTARCKVRSVG